MKLVGNGEESDTLASLFQDYLAHFQSKIRKKSTIFITLYWSEFRMSRKHVCSKHPY